MNIFLVGGAVRDELLGFPFDERDWVVVGSTPDDMLNAGYQQVGNDFPVFLHPKSREEYALARTERKSGRGYTGFTVNADTRVTLEEDLSRRDLTLNAIAKSAEGKLIDPYGGQRDIQDRVLRHVSPAFTEDPLRVLRVARFAARYAHLGFSIAPETQELMRTMAASGELDALVPERIWKETSRALLEKTPAEFFRVLKHCGALGCIFPEIDALFGVPQPVEHHPEVDTGEHTLLSLAQACELSDQLEVRFAALVHDLGKAKTPEKDWPKHHGHEKISVPLIIELCDTLRVPNSCRDLAAATAEFHTHCHRAFELTPKTLNKLFTALGAYKSTQKLTNFLLACEADAKGRTGLENRDYPQGRYLLAAIASCQGVTAAPFIAEGLQGAAIGEALTRERMRRLAEFKKSYTPRN